MSGVCEAGAAVPGKPRPALQSPLMPTSATATENAISPTYALPGGEQVPPPPLSPAYPVLSLVDTGSPNPEPTPAPLTVSAILSRLSPVKQAEIPVSMLSTAPPVLAVLAGRTTPATPVPSLASPAQEGEDILDSLSSSLDVPLYSFTHSGWTKLSSESSAWSNENKEDESSFLGQSWDETQTLPLFEPTLDFDHCFMEIE